MILLATEDVAAPEEPTPREPEPFREGVRLEWEVPWLDRTWTLTENASPLVRLVGATETGRADFEHWWASSPLVPGATWQGGRHGLAEYTLPLAVVANDSLTFLAEHDAFQAACDERQESVLRSVRPDGQVRETFLRYGNGADVTAVAIDPVRACVATYAVLWYRADPFWRGAQVRVAFPFETPPPFFPGPPFILAAGNSLNAAQITNPGDEPTFATWRVDGPFTGFSVGIGSALVSMTVTKLAGEWVEVNMTPGIVTFLDQSGAEMNDYVTEVEFAEIPPGRSDLVTTVTDSAVGSGVTLTFTPRFKAAW